MSDVRVVAFPTLEEKAEKPTWLERGAGPMLPPPFLRGHVPDNDVDEREPPTLPSERPPAPTRTPTLTRQQPVSVLPPEPRRSQFPSAMSHARPLTVPPPPRRSEAPEDDPPSAEQLEFVQAAYELAATRPRIVSHVEGELLGLAVRIAEAIIGREVQADPALHVELARSALAALGDASSATLRASPRSYDAIVSVQGAASVSFDGILVDVVRDPSLDGLGCVAEGESAQVDGRVEERLSTLLRTFVAASHRRNEAP